MISKETINKITQVSEILEVVGDFVSLRRNGANYWACCPFHGEKTPSFSVAPAKNIYYCFGCHKTGDPISFVMEMDKCSYPDALRYLAKKYHIEIEETAKTPEQTAIANEKESLLIVLDYANRYYRGQLSKNTIGQSYFQERGFAQSAIDKFELGYSQDLWNDLEQQAVNSGFTKDVLHKAGLVIQNENGKSYDRFRGRVMFPIHNLSGRVVGFGARTLKKDDKPKYLNSPETAVYIKNEVLYGLYQAKNAIREQDVCLLVEGYADVISLYQNGVQNVVASSGTALTENQIRLIRRFTENVVVLYDGDTAGIKAALRGIDLLLAQGLNVKAVTLPPEEDPDSLVRKIGGEAFKDYLAKNAKDFITFKIELLLVEANNDPLKKATVIRSIVESIALIPDRIKQSVFYQKCSELLGISEDVLKAEGTRTKKQTLPNPSPTQPPPTQVEKPKVAKSLVEIQEHESIRLLVKYGEIEIAPATKLWQYFTKETADLPMNSNLYREILQAYLILANNGRVDLEMLLQKVSVTAQKLIQDLLHEKHEVSANWTEKHDIKIATEKDDLPKTVFKNILRLKHRIVEQAIKDKQAKFNDNTSEKDLQEYQAYLQLKMSLAKEIGLVVG